MTRWQCAPEPITKNNSLFRQLRLQLWEAYCQVRYLCSHLRGNDSADSAVSTDSSMDESSETSSAKDVPAGSLRTALSELKRLIQSIVDGMEPTVRGQAERLLPCRARLVGGCTQTQRARLTLNWNRIKSARIPPEPLRALNTGSPPEGPRAREWEAAQANGVLSPCSTYRPRRPLRKRLFLAALNREIWIQVKTLSYFSVAHWS